MKGEMPIGDRAGTRLNHSQSEKVFQRRHGKPVYCGILDRSQRVYQCGGELNKQVYWKRKVMGLGLDEWAQIRDRVDWYEFVELTKNVCYRVSIAVALERGYEYDGEWGRRFGIPLDAFELFDGPGLQPRPVKPPEPPDLPCPPAQAPQEVLF